MELRLPDYIVVIVEDLDRSIEFYVEQLGLTLSHRSGEYAQLHTGPTRLSLYSRSAMSETLGRTLSAPSPDAPGFELGFKVDDVDAAFAELTQAGVESSMPPTDRFWGQRTAYLRDPDGHLIELVQDHRREKAES